MTESRFRGRKEEQTKRVNYPCGGVSQDVVVALHKCLLANEAMCGKRAKQCLMNKVFAFFIYSGTQLLQQQQRGAGDHSPVSVTTSRTDLRSIVSGPEALRNAVAMMAPAWRAASTATSRHRSSGTVGSIVKFFFGLLSFFRFQEKKV